MSNLLSNLRPHPKMMVAYKKKRVPDYCTLAVENDHLHRYMHDHLRRYMHGLGFYMKKVCHVHLIHHLNIQLNFVCASV